MSDTNQSIQDEDARDVVADTVETQDAAQAAGNSDTKNKEGSADDGPPEETSFDRSDPNIAIVNDSYCVRTDKRLPDLDNGPVKAFEAFSSTNKNLFAMVCETHLPPRFKEADIYQKNAESSLLRFVSSGTSFLKSEGAYKHVLIYEGNIGKPVLGDPQGKALGWKPDKVMRSFLKPLIEGLRGLRDLDLYHGHVRLDNIFGVSASGANEKATLGDCLSLPAQYTDHSIYLPPQKALAMKSGRGLGNISDDLYSLGVCAAILLRSADPTVKLSENEIIKMKLAQGSYMTLTNKDRFSGGILELLRGLLQDDPSQRWTMDEVIDWMDGQRLVPKQGVKRNKAARPMVIGDQRFYYAETLAMELPDNLSEATQQIENNTLEQWISRSIENTKMVEKLEVAIRTAREYGRTNYYQDRLICRTSIVLDPKQPIRYRGYSLFPDGIGVAMAEAFKNRKDMSPFIQMINQHIVPYWLDLQGETFIDVGAIAVAFENCRNSLKQHQAGYGLERCVYVLAPELPCLSEQYDGFVIREAQDFLEALNELAEKKKMPRDIFDTHITAFLMVRHSRMIDPHLPELNSSEKYRRILGTIKTLSSIQKGTNAEELKALTKWAADYVKPFFDRYHDRDIREEKIQEIEKIKGKGNLRDFVNIMDDPKALQKDAIDFKKAIRDYYKLKVENYKYEKSLSERQNYGMSSGREFAAIVSGVIASVIILAVTFIFFSGGNVVP